MILQILAQIINIYGLFKGIWLFIMLPISDQKQESLKYGFFIDILSVKCTHLK